MTILQSLFRPSKSLIGLDISSSAVKLLELSQKGDGYCVEAFAVEPLPPNAVVDKQVADPEVVTKAVQRALQRSGVKPRNAAIAVAGASVITKIIPMSGDLRDAEMEEQIRAEADQYIPYPIEEVNLDFHVIGASNKDAGSVDVLLAACRREQVDQRVAAVEAAGLKVTVVDIEAYTLENAYSLLAQQLPNGGNGMTVALVDMGASTTSVLILHDGATIYARDQGFGGRQLTEEIMRTYGLSLEDAGRLKRAGGLPDDYESNVLSHFLSDMAQQIDRALQFFFAASAKHGHVDQILLAGGCAHIPGVDRVIQERLQIPTAIARPFAKMAVSAKAKPAQLAMDESSLLIACGLAMRAFDEVPA